MSSPEQAFAHWQQRQERERAALAQQLHGPLGGLLAAMGLQLHHASLTGSANLANLHSLLAQAQDCQRLVSAQLSPLLLPHLGLPAALTALFEQRCAEHALALQLDLAPMSGSALSIDKAIALYRTAEIALANVLQHAAARTVSLALGNTSQQWQLTISDDGSGCDPAQAWAVAGSLCAVRAWLQGLGGNLTVALAAPRGTRISATVDF